MSVCFLIRCDDTSTYVLAAMCATYAFKYHAFEGFRHDVYMPKATIYVQDQLPYGMMGYLALHVTHLKILEYNNEKWAGKKEYELPVSVWNYC